MMMEMYSRTLIEMSFPFLLSLRNNFVRFFDFVGPGDVPPESEYDTEAASSIEATVTGRVCKCHAQNEMVNLSFPVDAGGRAQLKTEKVDFISQCWVSRISI